MAKDKITEYDATANNNTVCGDVNIAENSALPSDMNNFAREIMSHLKEGLGSGTPLYVDQTNNRVGINKTPTVALDVSGDANLSGTLDVTGTITVGDSHTIGDDGDDNLQIATSVGENLIFKSSGNIVTYLDTNEDQSTAAYQIYGDVTSPRSLLRVEETGDVSFYEDTGTTPKLFWDASAERLGVGHSSPNVTLHVQGANVSSGDANHNVVIDDTTSMAQGVGGGIVFRGNYGSGLTNGGFIQTEKSNATSGNYAFDLVLGSRTNGSSPAERIRITSAGNVGIGNSSPSSYENGATNLVVGNTSDTGMTIASGTSNLGSIFFADGTSGGAKYEGQIRYSHTSNFMMFATGGTERMRIDSSGKVGIGTNNPYKSLTVGDSDETAYISAGGNNVNLSIASIGSSGSVIFKTGGTNGNATTTTERMRVRYDGKVGIGITNPEGALHIDLSGNGSEAGPHLQIGNSVGYSGYHWLDSTAYYIGQDSAIRQLRLYSGAETAGVVMGNGATSWSSFSDERLKKDIEPISNGLQKLADLRCVSYRLKDVDAEDSQKKLGIIAQDLVNKVDEVINLTKRKDDETEYMSVRYTEMIPVLIKAIQELKAELDSAKARITALENGE